MVTLARSRADWFRKSAVLLLFGSAAAVYAFSRDYYYFGRLNDDVRYFLASRSLLEGRYVDLSHPQEPPLLHQLPGYPLLLLPAAACNSPRLAQWMNIGFMLGILALLMRLLNGTSSTGGLTKRIHVLAVVALTALNPLSVFQATAVMTEVPYLFFTTWALIRLVSLLEGAGEWNLSNTMRLAALCAFCGWIRPDGALLMLTAALLILERPAQRRWGWLFLVGGCLFLSLPYLRNLCVSGTPEAYFAEMPAAESGVFSQFSGVVSIVAYNLARYPFMLTSESMFSWIHPLPGADSTIVKVFGLGVLVLLFSGVRRGMKEGALGRALGVYSTIYVGLHLFWINQSQRYIFPVLPFLYWFLLRSVVGFRRGIAVAAMLCGVFFMALDGVNIASARPPRAGENLPPIGALEWIRVHVPRDQVLAAASCEAVRYYTGRKTIELFSRSSDPDQWLHLLLAHRVEYVVDDAKMELIPMVSSKRRELESVASLIRSQLRDASRFRLSYQDPVEPWSVYRFLKPPGFEEGFRLLQDAKEAIRNGRLELADSYLKKAETMRAPLMRLAFYRGTTAMLLGKKPEARKYLEQALRQEPDFDPARRNLVLLSQ